MINAGAQTITIEETGDEAKVNALIELLRPYGIKEIVRTGRIALAKE